MTRFGSLPSVAAMATAQPPFRPTSSARRPRRAAILVPLVSLVLGAAGLATSGCGPSNDLGMSDSTYVAAMSGLERLERNAAAPITQGQRDSVMRALGVTPTELERAAELLARQPGRASELWRAIDRRSRETE